MLLGAAIGIMAPLGAGGRVEPIQAQNQAPPPEGFRIIGNVYWVGGEYGFYLITTPAGHILHDTGTNEMRDTIVSNVKKQGFEVKDIEMMISSHAHFDHVQGHPQMKKLTGARVVALGGDAAALEAGQDNSAGGFRGMVGGPRGSRNQRRGNGFTGRRDVARPLGAGAYAGRHHLDRPTSQEARKTIRSHSAAVRLLTRGFRSSIIPAPEGYRRHEVDA